MKTRKSRPVGFYLAGSWLGLMVFIGLFGWILPLPQWDEAFFDDLGVGPFSPRHLLGTTQDGYDMLAGLVNGARLSVFISFASVLIGGGIGALIGITAAYFRGKYDLIVVSIFNILLSIPNLVLSLALLSVFAYSDADNPASTNRRVDWLLDCVDAGSPNSPAAATNPVVQGLCPPRALQRCHGR